MAFLVSLVPGVCRPAMVKELSTVSSKPTIQEKVEEYCQVSKRWYKQGFWCSAFLPLWLASRAVNGENVSFGAADKIKCLCKIALQRSSISTSKPEELAQAAHLATTISADVKSQSPVIWSQVYDQMAMAYLEAKDLGQAHASFALQIQYWLEAQKPPMAVVLATELSQLPPSTYEAGGDFH